MTPPVYLNGDINPSYASGAIPYVTESVKI